MKIDPAIFHEFFYNDDPQKSRTARSNTSYIGPDFYSYSTQIGKIITDKEGGKYLLYSAERFSATTSGHISALLYASPFDRISVPFHYGDSYVSAETLFSRLIDLINKIDFSELSRKNNRETATERIYSAEKIAEITGIKIHASTRKTFNEIREICAEFEKNRSAAKKRAESRNQAAKKRAENRIKAARAALKKKIEKALPGWGIMEKAKAFYDDTFPEYRELLREWKNTFFPEYSFVFYQSNLDTVRTSQSVAMSPDTAARAYKAFKAGKIKAGMHLGPYEIREITADFVRIGCHKIPLENIRELATLLNWND